MKASAGNHAPAFPMAGSARNEVPAGRFDRHQASRAGVRCGHPDSSVVNKRFGPSQPSDPACRRNGQRLGHLAKSAASPSASGKAERRGSQSSVGAWCGNGLSKRRGTQNCCPRNAMIARQWDLFLVRLISHGCSQNKSLTFSR